MKWLAALAAAAGLGIVLIIVNQLAADWTPQMSGFVMGASAILLAEIVIGIPTALLVMAASRGKSRPTQTQDDAAARPLNMREMIELEIAELRLAQQAAATKAAFQRQAALPMPGQTQGGGQPSGWPQNGPAGWPQNGQAWPQGQEQPWSFSAGRWIDREPIDGE